MTCFISSSTRSDLVHTVSGLIKHAACLLSIAILVFGHEVLGRVADGITFIDSGINETAVEKPPVPGDQYGVLVWLPSWAIRKHLHERFERPLKDIWPSPHPNRTVFYGEHMEDRHLYTKYFYGMRRGVYLEVGAYDGLLHSTTKFFAQNLGWRGLLVEASPAAFSRLVHNRPHDVCVRSVICATRGNVTFVTGQGPADGVLELMTPQHIALWHPPVVLNLAARTGQLAHTYCSTLHTILDYYRINRIDFISLDINGGELEVLRTIDFTRLSVHVIMVRSDASGSPYEATVRTLLRSSGYQSEGTLLGSEWFVHHLFLPSAVPAPGANLKDEGEGYLNAFDQNPEDEEAEKLDQRR